MVALFEFYPFKNNTDFSDLPESTVPYFVPAKEAVYLRKETALGPVMLPHKEFDHLQSMGRYKGGYFSFKAPPVSKEVISQAYKFFAAVYEKDKTEAELLILFDEGTKEYSLMPPYQVVTLVSVSSIFDQADIPEHLTVVGTIHSHCDFSAFHSGTDDNDASDFNGLHITIGHVDTKSPSFDAMVTNNKAKFDYKDNLDVVADTSDLEASSYPKEWFDYLFKDAKDIARKQFKTLTAEELDKFVQDNKPLPTRTLTVVQGGKKSKKFTNWFKDDTRDDYDWWHKGTDYSYLADSKWSDEFRKSFPRDWFDGSGYNAKLTDEGFEFALTEVLENLFDKARARGIFLEYDLISDIEDVEDEDILDNTLLTKGS